MKKAEIPEVIDLFRYAPKWCGEGERKFLHIILEEWADNKVLIRTINSPLTLGSTEVVFRDMLERVGTINTKTNEFFFEKGE